MSTVSYRNWPVRHRLRIERKRSALFRFGREEESSTFFDGDVRMEGVVTSPPRSPALVGELPWMLHDVPFAMPTWKRVLDICGATAALLLLGPIMFLISLVIKLVSPGPIFFRQERVGYNGKTFNCFKFRSMRVETATDVHRLHFESLMSSSEPMMKLDLKNDSRLIPMGRLLRSSALDELPQLFNVLRGDMSLVGPRPCIPYEYEGYTDEQKRRVLAYPGLTGLWQVNGKNRTTFEEMVNYDIQYAWSKSLWMDLYILVKTPAVILTQLFDLTQNAQEQEKLLEEGHHNE